MLYTAHKIRKVFIMQWDTFLLKLYKKFVQNSGENYLGSKNKCSKPNFPKLIRSNKQ